MEIINLHLLRPWSTCKVWISHADVSSAVWYELYDHPNNLQIESRAWERGRWNERGRAIWLWCKGLGTTKETKQDGGNYTGPSERLSNESEPLSRGIHLLQAIAKEQIIFLTFFFCVVHFFPREQISVLNIVQPPWPVCKKMASQLRW